MVAEKTKAYRLGLDLGSNSLGWFTVDLAKNGDRFEPIKLGPGGVRIFSDGRDPQSKSSLAVDRRMARGARKRRDRFVERRKELIASLVKHGLMPADAAARKALETRDPYALRRDALIGALPAHHIGRALFHLNQRRGFKSNRKTDKPDQEGGAIKQAASRLLTDMGNATLGAFMADRHLSKTYEERQSAIRDELKKRGKDHLTGNARKKAWAKARKALYGDEVLPAIDAPNGVRARATITGTKASYDYYPTRDMLEREFADIWDTQAKHHSALMSDAARNEIHDVIFFQRPLKPAVVGKCTLDPSNTTMAKDPEGYRAPWWHPLAQRFRMLQEVRNLEIRETGAVARKLTKDESDTVFRALSGRNDLSFDKMRGLLKLPSEAKFNLESDRRDRLDGDETAARLSHKKAFGEAWRGFPLDRQIEIAAKLDATEREDEMIAWLEKDCELSPAAAAKAANTMLPDGHSRVGLRAIKAMLPHLEAGMGYHDAAKTAGYDHAQLPTGEQLDRLPYYGKWLADDVVGSGDARDKKEKQFGQFPNPTVHIGLGQLRRTVNALIDQYGPPTEIAIEFTRALKLSEKQKSEIQREQRKNQEKNRQRAAELARFGHPANPRNLLKMRLWEDLARDPLDRKCVYTGEQIGIETLLSAQVDIDHILPVSMTLDDSAANKIICMAYANKHKKKMTPIEAFGSSPSIQGYRYDWSAIAARAAGLPRNKRWRFDADAREKFEERGGFLARQLNETGWLARLAKQYLAAVTDPNKIRVVPGRLTSMLRGKWGLNSLLPDANFGGVETRADEFRAATDDMEFSGIKNRADHRHHAIDGLVVALTDRSLLHKMANAYDDDRDKFLIDPPWPTLRDDLKEKLGKMVVSHRADHGIEGKLHEDTAYGLVKDPAKEGGRHFVRRKAIASLSAKEIGNIRDPRLREMVQNHVAAQKKDGVELKAALENFRTLHDGDPHIKHGVQTVRVLVPEDPAYTVAIVSRQDGKSYKAYAAGENLFVDIAQNAKGKWIGRAVTRFVANQSDVQPMRFTGEGTPVMRIFKGDLIALDYEGARTIMVVRQLDASNNRIKLAAHNETGNLQLRHDTDREIDPFRWLMASYNTLKSLNAVAVRVDALGRVWRLPPPEM